MILAIFLRSYFLIVIWLQYTHIFLLEAVFVSSDFLTILKSTVMNLYLTNQKNEKIEIVLLEEDKELTCMQ